ncbi:YaeF family permuted papain-like enzyme [Enterobacter hormaechei]
MKMQSALHSLLVSSLFLFSGCTLDVSRQEGSANAVDAQSKPWAIKLQRQSSLSEKKLLDITETELKAGDLLFSSSIGVTSLGIRLLSTSSVSHVAIYLGDHEVAEATGDGVQIISLTDAMKHSDKLFALRVPDLTPEQAAAIRRFAQQAQHSRYNYRGIIEFVPFMVTKQLCSLNPFSDNFRQQCINGFAAAQLSSTSEVEKKAWFCSEFVTDAFLKAGHPLTMAEAGWITPSDLLHMREGDVATYKPETQLQYVGHLKPGIYIKTRRFVGLMP